MGLGHHHHGHGGHEPHDDHHLDHAAEPGALSPRPDVLKGRRRLRIALGITAVFMTAEAVGGYLANSQALMADAAHMLSDSGALVLSLLAIRFAARPATGRKSFGWMRLEILAALANGVTLVLIAIAIFWESVHRLRVPEPVDVPLMTGIAALGLVANAVSAFVLHEPHDSHLNVRAAYIHILGDLVGALGAIVAGVIMWRTGWYTADPIVAILVGVLILWSSVQICRQAADVLLEGVPAHIELERLERELAEAPGVGSVHHLHVWTISSGVHLMSCHVVVGDHGDHHEILDRLSCLVRERFGIAHSTIQLECEDLSAKEVGTGFCDRQ
jgi:cobalt-zinc-cadmium efflux system protein